MSIKQDKAEIRIENVSHRYNSQLAVDGVSFAVSDQRIIGLLGANGAGKSTLMNIICGVLTPTLGNVFIDGFSILSEPLPAKQRLGFLPQKPPLLTDLTVEEYLRYAAELRSVAELRPAVESAMEKCGIAHFRKRLIKHLSGGYQQRVGIAQAIIHRPAFIVLDEPTNGLDPTQIVEIRKLIKEISSECLVMLSTHILHEVEQSCDYILMMAHGRLIFAGGIEKFNSCISPVSVIVSMGEPPEPAALLSVPGIVSVERTEDGLGTFRISFDGDADEICEAIVCRAACDGWRLREVAKEQPSADDIFKHLCARHCLCGN